DVSVEEMGLGSDHLPIKYVLDLELSLETSARFNPKSMDDDKFLEILQHELGKPITQIETQQELDEAMDAVMEALVRAVEGSTKRRRPCAHSKRWWTKELTGLVK
ncbi:hypothetical protein B0H16DRAFT_1261243, partial [Mycena metata]